MTVKRARPQAAPKANSKSAGAVEKKPIALHEIAESSGSDDEDALPEHLEVREGDGEGLDDETDTDESEYSGLESEEDGEEEEEEDEEDDDEVCVCVCAHTYANVHMCVVQVLTLCP